MPKKISTREIVSMCESGNAELARKELTALLSAASVEAKAEQRSLLDTLRLVEVREGRWKEALQLLERRRALGYRTVASRMDATLEAATLLKKAGRFVEARAELTELLRNRRSLQWDGLLQALSVYTLVDELCRQDMEPHLALALDTVIKRFGIPLEFDKSRATVLASIEDACGRFHADSQAYSELLCRALTQTRRENREGLLRDIQDFANGIRTEFFRDEARRLSDRMTKKRGRAINSRRRPNP